MMYTFPFGKYKGEQFEHIAFHHPSYVLWFAENVRRITLPKEIVSLVKKNYSIEEKRKQANREAWCVMGTIHDLGSGFDHYLEIH